MGSYESTILGTGHTKMLCVGDSITEGMVAPIKPYRWQSILLGKIRKRYSLPGSSLGMFPPGHTPFSGMPEQTYTSSSGTLTVMSEGLGRHSLRVSSGGYVQFTITAQAFEVIYSKASGAGSIAVSIDGAAAVETFSTNATASYSNVKSYTIGGSPGSHTVRLTATGGVIYVEGITPYDTSPTGPGIISWDCSHSGDASIYFDATGTNLVGTPNFAPHLVIDEQCGVNDQLGVSGTITPTQTATYLSGRLSLYNGMASNPTVLVLIYWNTPVMDAASVDWDNYRTAVTAAALAGGAHVLDLVDYYPTVDPTWIGADNLHPSAIGHQKIAEAIDATLAALVPVADPPLYKGTLAADALKLGDDFVPRLYLGANLIYDSQGVPPAPATHYRTMSALTGPTSNGSDFSVTLGTRFEVTATTQADAIWVSFANGLGARAKFEVGIYLETGVGSGVLLWSTGTTLFGVDPTNGWNRFAITSGPLLLVDQKYYVAAYFDDTAGYTATANFWSSGAGASDLTAGPIKTTEGGYNYVEDALAYPGNVATGGYWVDIEGHEA